MRDGDIQPVVAETKRQPASENGEGRDTPPLA
jgi:hypothetical protein